MTVPWYLWPLVLIPVVAMTLTTARTVFKPKSAAALGFAGLWLAWTAACVWLGAKGLLSQSPGAANPAVPLAVFGGLVLLVLPARIPSVARQLAESVVKLVVPQMYRITGAVFLIALALGMLPPVFALPAALGDIAVGVGAIAITVAASRREPSRKTLVWFNILGIIDLVVAVGTGTLAGLGPAQLIHTSPSTLAVTQLPLVLIPAVAVPLVAALHVVSLIRLRQRSTAPDTVRIGQQPHSQLHGL